MVDWENGEPRLRPDVQPRCGTGLPMGTPGDPGLYHRGSLPGQAPATDGREGRGCFLLQKRLRQLGYYQHRPDGIFGYGTEQALKKFQQEEGLPVTGQVGWAEYKRLRLLSEE